MLYERCQYANHKTSKTLVLPFILTLLFLLNACRYVGIPTEEGIPYPFNLERTWKAADSTRQAQTGWMYADTYTRPFYQSHTHQLLWATEYGIDERADTLLNYLRTVEKHGLKASSFHVKEIEDGLQKLRALKPDSCEESEVCLLEGQLDYLLSEAYMRYAYGQRYGYIRPHKLFNNLLLDTPEPGSTSDTKKYRRIFDIDCDIPSDSLFNEALEALDDADDLSEFLQDIQPEASLYHRLSEEYQNAVAKGDKERKRLCVINLERSRWRYPRPTEDKYVWVNLADFMLSAVDSKRDSVLIMRVCGGDPKHKTPLLHSHINKLELNPYWVIPTSIIRNELIPRHLNDSSYYTRNNIVAIDKKTGMEIQAWRLTENQLRSGQYTLRQEKGEGNSLGRMIFRFPNDFSVYLHDTNSPGAFNRENRAVSHGCIRVQRPLDLATFLMDDPDEFTIDKVRIAIGQPPLSEKGKKLIENNPETQGMSTYIYKPHIPVYLDYYTLYPSATDGILRSHPDSYGYDKEIERILNQF